METDGWQWAESPRILTLKDVEIDVASGHAIVVPSYATIHGEGSVTITAQAGRGISGNGNVKITGTLGDITAKGDGIWADDSIVIEGTVGNITAPLGIVCLSSEHELTISGKVGDINTDSDGTGIYSKYEIIIDGTVGKVSAGREGVSAPTIRINKPITVSGGEQAFFHAPGLGSSGLAVTAWSKNANGSAPESGAIDWATAKYVVISNP